MAIKPQIKTLRAHKVAALVLDARLYARRTPEEACGLLGWDLDHLTALETATVTPSLPELEALAAIYAVPMDHFFGSTSLSDSMPQLRTETMQQRLELRNRILGAMIMQARSRKNLSRDDLATLTDLSLDNLTAYELGLMPLPVTDLEEITRILQIDINDWIDSYAIPTRDLGIRASRTAQADQNQGGDQQPSIAPPAVEPAPAYSRHALSGETVPVDNLEALLGDNIPKELADFIANPVNRQYLLLANNLSVMPADQLRRIAESLLEITF